MEGDYGLRRTKIWVQIWFLRNKHPTCASKDKEAKLSQWDTLAECLLPRATLGDRNNFAAEFYHSKAENPIFWRFAPLNEGKAWSWGCHFWVVISNTRFYNTSPSKLFWFFKQLSHKLTECSEKWSFSLEESLRHWINRSKSSKSYLHQIKLDEEGKDDDDDVDNEDDNDDDDNEEDDSDYND